MTTTLKSKDSTTGSNLIELQIQKEDFLKAVSVVLGAISSKATVPILSNILIQTDGPDKISLTATDLELGIKTECPATVNMGGSVTVPAKKLHEILRELPTGEIEVIVAKNNAVNIKTNRSFFKIMGLEPDDFPKLPEPTPEQSFELDQQTLQKCLVLTSFAISRDETRYTLNGVLVVVRSRSISFVATDGKRLAYIERETTDTNNPFEMIVPAKTVLELIKTLSEDEQKAKIVCAQNQTIFKLNKTLFVSRLIEGKFPNYEQVIPKDEKTTTQVDRQELLSALRRVSLLTSQENQSVKLDFIKGKLLISSKAANLGEAKEEILTDVVGEDLTIGFNPTYLIDALKNLESEKVTLVMTGQDKPGLVKTNEGYLYVVMPMQLN